MQQAIVWFRYVRAVSNASLLNAIAFKLLPVVLAIAYSRTKVPILRLSLVATYGVIGLAILRRFSRRTVVRAEGIKAVETPDELDYSFRNPRWARLAPNAVRLKNGYDPILAVDGTPEIVVGDQKAGSKGAPQKGQPAQLDVWLMPFATYHIDELGPILRELQSSGAKAGFVFETVPTQAQLATLSIYADAFYLASDMMPHPPAAVLTMMDWGPAESLLSDLRRAGTLVISKIEGAQDFRNLDTPRRVLPYSRSDLTLAQGRFDSTWAPASDIEIVGSTRLERVWNLQRADALEKVTCGPLMNLNFSYGTYEAWLRPWYELASRGLASADIGQPHTSVHPAVSGQFVTDRSPWPLALGLEISSLLVTRCSTALFDALLMGRPVAYFNPHRERVWRHVEWNAVVPEVASARELSHWAASASQADQNERQTWVREQFVSIEDHAPSAERAADVVLRRIGMK